MVAVIVWTMALFVFMVEMVLRFELSLRNYRRNYPERAAMDRQANRLFNLKAVGVHSIMKGLPTLIPVIVIVQFGGIGAQIGLFGCFVLLAWQLIRLYATVVQTINYMRTGHMLDGQGNIILVEDA